MVLLVALLVLLLLGMIATTVARTSLLQLHMAGNDEARIAALQQALAVIDAIVAGATALPIDRRVGYRVCATDSPDETCDERSIALDPGALPAAGSLDFAVTRLAPPAERMPVMGEARASSAVYYRVAKFEIDVGYDAGGEGAGRSALAQGVLVRLPSSPQAGGGSP